MIDFGGHDALRANCGPSGPFFLLNQILLSKIIGYVVDVPSTELSDNDLNARKSVPKTS